MFAFKRASNKFLAFIAKFYLEIKGTCIGPNSAFVSSQNLMNVIPTLVKTAEHAWMVYTVLPACVHTFMLDHDVKVWKEISYVFNEHRVNHSDYPQSNAFNMSVSLWETRNY